VSSLVEKYKPQELTNLLGFQLPQEGKGKDGLLSIVERILHYSVNTWDRGFMHKLSASTNAVGLVSELVLSVLNANVIFIPIPNSEFRLKLIEHCVSYMSMKSPQC
jgi:glutamate decarboxylase